MTTIKPEISYDFVPLTREDIVAAYSSGTTVTGYVESILPAEKILEVRLGIGIIGVLPFSEATMYPLRYSKKKKFNIPTNIHCLTTKKIRVKITDVSGDEITLSRKANMIEAYFKLQNMQNASMYITEVIEKSAFGDIGEGLTGKILINEVCRTHIRHIKHRLAIGQTINVAMLGVDSEKRFAASYRQTFKPFCKEDYPLGMVITAKIGDWIEISDTSRYYVEVTPQVAAILRVYKHYHLDYGTEVECVVTGANDKGLYLELLKQP